MVVLAMLVGKIALTKDPTDVCGSSLPRGVALLTIGDLVYAREAILGTYEFGGPLDALVGARMVADRLGFLAGTEDRAR